MLRLLFLIPALLLAAPLRASSPEDTVRWIYESLASAGSGPQGLAYLATPEQREQYFSARMVAWFRINDTYRVEKLPGCWPHMFDVPTADADPAEIARTLTLTSTYAPDRQTVTASFLSHGTLARITYEFVAEDGFLRIDDIAGPGWSVSRITCTPLGGEPDSTSQDSGVAATYDAGSARFCYVTGEDRLQLRVQDDGSAELALVSRQSTGHKCEAQGKAGWTGRGWILEAGPGDSGCRLEILLTREQGLRLRDRDFSCKPYLCGPRAVLDGLVFERGDQVDCTLAGLD